MKVTMLLADAAQALVRTKIKRTGTTQNSFTFFQSSIFHILSFIISRPVYPFWIENMIFPQTEHPVVEM